MWLWPQGGRGWGGGGGGRGSASNRGQGKGKGGVGARWEGGGGGLADNMKVGQMVDVTDKLMARRWPAPNAMYWSYSFRTGHGLIYGFVRVHLKSSYKHRDPNYLL